MAQCRKNSSESRLRSFCVLLLGSPWISVAHCAKDGNCTSALAASINDGVCDEVNNNRDCGYDGGDCCLCTCVHNVACAFAGFNCLDPDVGDELHDCTQPSPTADLSCSSIDNQQSLWVVESAAEAKALAGAVVKCPGAVFDVEWGGSIVVEEAIYVADGTILTVNGVGANAGMDAKATTRFFTVVNASLHVSGMTFTDGNATVGGAIAAAGALTTLTFNETTFIGNAAAGHGGAIYVRDATTASYHGETVFANNVATGDGGAMYADGSSDVSWSGDITVFSNNLAHADGGAVFLHGASTTVSWSGSTTFTGNSAKGAGGAIAAFFGSTASWGGQAAFVNNSAEWGGAVDVLSFAHVFWTGQAMFAYNRAASIGGGMNVYLGSRISWTGDTTFLNNYAGAYGGAVSAEEASSVSWTGNTTFLNNDGGESGGAVSVALQSTVSLVGPGGTIFQGNVANLNGGALTVNSGSKVSWNEQNVTFLNNYATIGGALLVFNGSRVSWTGGKTYFTRNSAEMSGGALLVLHGSSVTWAGEEIRFTQNSVISGGGGALSVFDGSNVTWIGGATKFTNNSAETSGGALDVFNGSIVSWTGGETEFTGNIALHSAGGALMVSRGSSVTWTDGTTKFTDNRADLSGGALVVFNDSSVTWAGGETEFTGNSAFFGGAFDVSNWSSVTWTGGDTRFTGNFGHIHGGALAVSDGSSVAWTGGSTNFSNNSAVVSGGALDVFNKSSLAWTGGETYFTGNSVLDATGGAVAFGGAMAFRDQSNASWTGKTHFLHNSAAEGGAVFSSGNSSVSWSKVGDPVTQDSRSSISVDGEVTTFVNNSATGSGGAIMSLDKGSRISWSGNTTFSSNTAEIYGGALSLVTGARASWDGNVTFSSNRARMGGAVFVLQECDVSWGGDTTFANNRATYGGALSTFSGAVFWEGHTVYFNNSAEYGGGVYIINASTVEWGGRTYFLSNYAVSDGGAVGTAVSDNLLPPSLTINGVTIFENNTCGGNGAGLALTGDVSTTFGTMLDLTFSGNLAELAGGGVFISGVGVGPVLEDILFISNVAQVGGAVYATGSGTAQEENLEDNVRRTFPVIFKTCTFIGNIAKGTGGAMECAAGNYVVTNTSFTRNTARVGGALRLAGSASLDDCSFVENSSDDGGGPAVSNIGHVSEISNSSFINNVFQCEPETFLDFNVSTEPVLFDTLCSGCEVPKCKECRLGGDDQPLIPMCTPIMEHARSAGGTVTLEMLSIDQGHWRATATSREVLPCYNADACLGGVTGSVGYCRDGYQGPYCSVCRSGYSASLGFTCTECYSSAGGIALAVVCALLTLGALIVLVFYMVSKEEMLVGEEDKGFIASITRRIPLQSIKVIIVAWQILTQFASVANVTYPDVYQRFLDGIDILNFDLSWIISAGCLFSVNFHDQLLLATIGPFVVMASLGATYVIAMRRHRGSSNGSRSIQVVRQKHLSMVLLVMFLVYSSVSSIVFRTFACERLDDGNNYLRYDYRIQCETPKHLAFQVYAGFMILVYAVGIPLFYGALLFRNRDVLTDEVGRVGNPRVKSMTDLWKPYKPRRFYYEVIECGRRILLTGVVVFIYPNTAAQIAVTLMIAVAFMIIAEALAPFTSRWDAWLSRTGHLIVFTSMYVALLLRVDVSNERASSQRVFEIILVTAHACMISAVVLEAMVTCFMSREPLVLKRENLWPRRRRGRGVTSFLEDDPEDLSSPDDCVVTDGAVGARHKAHEGPAA